MKVILDTDPGIDDAMALMYLHALPQIELLGISTTPGNASLAQCTQNALLLCELLEISAPVFAGQETRINGSRHEQFPDFVHGPDGLAGLSSKPEHRTAEEDSAENFLIDSVRRHPGEVTLIAIGQLTNIALAISKDESFTTNVGELILMGGTINHPGNVTAWAEANIYCDPEAAGIVFESGIRTTMVGLDVTMQTGMSLAYINQIADAGPGDFLRKIAAFYGDYYKRDWDLDAFPVHDSSAIALVDQPAIFETRQGRLGCVLEGEQRGRTTFTTSDDGPHHACVAVDTPALLNRYRDVVIKHYANRQQGS